MITTLLDADFDKGLNSIPTTGIGNKGTVNVTNFLTPDLLHELGRWINLANIICLIMIVWGVVHLVTSLVGNNGKWRKQGTILTLTGYCLLLGLHIAIIGACAYGQLTQGKLIMFVLIALSQIVFYIGTPLLFMLGSEWLLLGEMTQTPQLNRQSNRAFNSITGLMIFGIITYTIAEVM